MARPKKCTEQAIRDSVTVKRSYAMRGKGVDPRQQSHVCGCSWVCSICLLSAGCSNGRDLLYKWRGRSQGGTPGY